MLVVDGTFCTIPTVGILWGGSFCLRRNIIAVKLLNDLLMKHKASLLLYDEICQLIQKYICSPNFDRFAKFKSRWSLLTSTQKTLNSNALQPINGTDKLHNNTLVTVPFFDTKKMIISLLSDQS